MITEESTEIVSSWLVNKWSIIAWFGCFIISIIKHQSLLAIFLLFVVFITSLSRLWGESALFRVEPGIRIQGNRFFPGQEIFIEYSIENKKFWPLIWLEWIQEFPKNNIITPIDKEEWRKESIDGERFRFVYRKRLAWVLWYYKVSWKSSWKARARGIYMMDNISLSSGDGFGLMAEKKSCALYNPTKIIIYPALIHVDTNALFKQVWGTQSGDSGFIEEMTLHKGIRDFQPGDPWKRINWRLAALQNKLQVNIYETVKYDAVYFIIDVNSFYNDIPKHQEFEESLSILGSTMVSLCEKRIGVGLSVPASGEYPLGKYTPGATEDHLLGMLEALSQLSIDESEDVYKDIYDLQLDDYISNIYLVSYCNKNTRDLEMVLNRKIINLVYKDNGDIGAKDSESNPYSIIDIKSLRENKGDLYAK